MIAEIILSVVKNKYKKASISVVYAKKASAKKIWNKKTAQI